MPNTHTHTNVNNINNIFCLFLEYYRQFVKAQNFHKTFLALNQSHSSFKYAEMNYITSSQKMSEQLTKSFVTHDHFCITIGLIFLSMVNLKRNFKYL